MSKKKAFSGSSMTLKDFHGGSIPSDLPLPSAPGVTVKPTDLSATSWGNPIGRTDHRVRPNSSPAARHFDDKTSLMNNSVHIGRYFDEDERKPLDGFSAPRRTVTDESLQVPGTHLELKPESAYAGRVSGRYGSSAPVSPLSGSSGNSYSSRVSEVAAVGVSSKSSWGNHRQAVSGAYPNAWAARMEVAVSVAEQSAVSKMAHASAIDKVSSGRWQSKQSVQCQKDVDVVSKHSETENGLHSRGYDDKTLIRLNAVAGREYSDVTSARQVGRGLNVKDGIQGEGIQSTHLDGKFGGSKSQPSLSVLPEASERPKLKLLPRTKPLDNLESPVLDAKKEQQWLSESVLSHAGISNDSCGYLRENGNQTVERPKLNLKPRLQPIEKLEINTEKERNALFGGARPRELVLKERGIDDGSHEPDHHLDRVKHDVPRSEKDDERVGNPSVDQRTGRKSERNHGVHNERVDTQRRNWNIDNRRNEKETEWPQRQQPERQPSPQTWRKPAEQQPEPASPEGVRHGKAASALELAQAFSKSISDQKTDGRYAGQSGLPPQMAFSRLMGPSPRPRINGC